jgi:hypothetical protein
MEEIFNTHQAFTFNVLDIEEVLALCENFINKESDECVVSSHADISFRDIKKTIALAEIKDFFHSGEYDQIHLRVSRKLGSIKWNQNQLDVFIDKKPKRLAILHENCVPILGKKLIDSFISKLDLIDIYDYRLLKIRSKDERSYLEEALICKNSGALRAAVIMAWNCVMHKIYYKIDKKYKIQFLNKISLRHEKNQKFKLQQINELEDYQQFKDREVLEICKELFLRKGLTTQLLHYLRVRNDCGHVRLWKPSELVVEAFFDEIFQSIF